MNKSFKFLLPAALIPLALATVSFADTIQCAECGMRVDVESKFASQIVQGAQKLMFCDIGDLLTYLNKKSASPAVAQVRDNQSGEWIRADKAFYVRSEKAFRTPMGWSIGAFKNREEAARFGAPLDLKEALRAVK